MAYVLVRQKVERFEAWKELFDTDAEVRAPGGSKGGHVFQNALDPNEVFVLLNWDSLGSLQEFLESDALKVRMQRAGVIGAPEVHLLELADSPSA